MNDEQQNSTNKSGLTPSPSNVFTPPNTNADSTDGTKFLMVPGQSAQIGSFSSGKIGGFDLKISI